MSPSALCWLATPLASHQTWLLHLLRKVELTWMAGKATQRACMSMGELAPPLFCQRVAWARERCLPPCLRTGGNPESWPRDHERKSWPRPFTCCSTQESRPCTTLAQHGRARPVSKGVSGELIQQGPAWARPGFLREGLFGRGETHDSKSLMAYTLTASESALKMAP